LKKLNLDLDYISELNNRRQSKGKPNRKSTELQFREFLRYRHRQYKGSNGKSYVESNDKNAGFSRVADSPQMRQIRREEEAREIQREMEEEREIRREMIQDPEGKISELLDSFNNINEETATLIEVKDIVDELQILQDVLKKQAEVLTSFTSHFQNPPLQHQPLQHPPLQSPPLQSPPLQSPPLQNSPLRIMNQLNVNVNSQSDEMKALLQEAIEYEKAVITIQVFIFDYFLFLTDRPTSRTQDQTSDCFRGQNNENASGARRQARKGRRLRGQFSICHTLI
jgi:hypothetical protein